MSKENFIGYRFGCSHGALPDAIKKGNQRAKLQGSYVRPSCPICGNDEIWKCYKCVECGRYFFRKIFGNPLRCSSCGGSMKPGQTGTRATKKKKKKPFDQTRRGGCKFGVYCIDRQIRTGKRFNCAGCTRFTPLELDPMDYVKTVSSWDTAEMFNGQLRRTRVNKPKECVV